MACMHMQSSHSAMRSRVVRAPGTTRCHPWPTKRVAARSSSLDSAPGGNEVARILQQHKLLMEHGFSYDQASLILQLSERRSTHSPNALEGQASAAQNTSASTTHSISDDQPEDCNSSESQQQHQQGWKGVEDRLSFLEMELLKQSIAVDAVSSLAGLRDADSAFSSSRVHFNQPGVPSAAADASQSRSSQLSPELLAIAESLLIRQGRVLPAPGSLQNPSTADSALYRQQYDDSLGQFYPSSSSSSSQSTRRAASSIWGRQRAARQLKAQPCSHRVEAFNPGSSSSSRQLDPARRMLPYGYLPDSEMVNSHDLELAAADELVPYEPNGWSVAGTVLLVYAGVLLTFFAVIAGTAEGSGTVDPDLIMMLW